MSIRALVHFGPDAAGVRRLLETSGGDALADYGPALLIRAEPPTLAALRQAGYRLRELEERSVVQVGGFAIDLRAGAQRAPETVPAGAAPEGRVARILQLAGPMHRSWSEQLAELEVTLYESLDAGIYLAGIGDARLPAVAELDFVEAVAPFPPALKLHTSLLSLAVSSELAAGEELLTPLATEAGPPPEPTTAQLTEEAFLGRRPERPPEEAGNLEVSFLEEGDPESLSAALVGVGARVIRVGARSAVVHARPSTLPRIAALPQVRAIHPHREPALCNNVAERILGVTRVRDEHGLDGAGQIVAIADTGLDTGDRDTVLEDFRDRIVDIQALGRPGDASDPDNHGTHVAGSVLGSGAASAGRVRGMAPGAGLLFQSVMDGDRRLGGLPDDLAAGLFQPAFDAGARIHTNSWGSPESDGGYLAFAHQADRFAFEHRDFLVLFAAGNDAPLRVSSPGTAKNALTVGASESERPLPTSVSFPNSPKFPLPSFPSGPVWGNFHHQADSATDIAAFSCSGPAHLGRIKPDVVAPGTFILSTRSTVSTADLGDDGLPDTGDEDGSFRHDEAVGRGLPGGPLLGAGSRPAPPLPDGAPAGAERLYFYSSGTSMATPLVAGACALLRQFLTGRVAAPSAALLKALVVHGARDVGLGVPHDLQGWGRLDLGRSLPAPGSGIHYDDRLDHAVASGEIRAYHAVVAPGAARLLATLAWRDPPGAALQNRLLLRVVHVATGTERAAESIAAIRNNVQRISLSDPQPGLYRIEVEGVDVPIGIPELDDLRQDFALAVSPVAELLPT